MLGTEPQLKATYIAAGQVRLIFNPVLSHGDRSYQTHQAAECAGEQGRFWDFHNVLFDNQDSFWGGDIRQTVKQLAAETGLNTESFNACLDEQRYLSLIESQDELRRQAGIRGQPVFDIHGEYLFGAQPFETFAQIIEAQLAQ